MLFQILIISALAAAVILALAVVVELIVPRERVSWRSRALGGGFFTVIFTSVIIISYYLGTLWTAFGVSPLLPPVEHWAGPAALPVTLILVDFLKYWEHRFEHRFFWPVHCVHHAPKDLHAASNYGHPLHALPIFFLVILPLSFLNFQSLAIPIAATLIIGLINALSHSPVDFHFGQLRHVIVDNRFHRIHHSLEPEHFNKNFGVILSVWDTLFGTAHFPKPAEWPKVGVATVAPPQNISRYLLMPFESGAGTGRRHFQPKRSGSITLNP